MDRVTGVHCFHVDRRAIFNPFLGTLKRTTVYKQVRKMKKPGEYNKGKVN